MLNIYLFHSLQQSSQNKPNKRLWICVSLDMCKHLTAYHNVHDCVCDKIGIWCKKLALHTGTVWRQIISDSCLFNYWENRPPGWGGDAKRIIFYFFFLPKKLSRFLQHPSPHWGRGCRGRSRAADPGEQAALQIQSEQTGGGSEREKELAEAALCF